MGFLTFINLVLYCVDFANFIRPKDSYMNALHTMNTILWITKQAHCIEIGTIEIIYVLHH